MLNSTLIKFLTSGYFGIVFLCFFNIHAFTQKNKAVEEPAHPIIKVETKIIEYDTIFQNSNTTKRIKVVNEGSIPLKIYNVRSSCGVSVPSWPRNPIEPGDSANIQMRYNSSNLGPINRKLIIHSNSPENTKVIKITGYVMPEPEK